MKFLTSSTSILVRCSRVDWWLIRRNFFKLVCLSFSTCKKPSEFISYSNFPSSLLVCLHMFFTSFLIKTSQLSCIVMAINLRQTTKLSELRENRIDGRTDIYINYWFVVMAMCLRLVQAGKKKWNELKDINLMSMSTAQSFKLVQIVLLLLQLYLQIASLLLNRFPLQRVKTTSSLSSQKKKDSSDCREGMNRYKCAASLDEDDWKEIFVKNKSSVKKSARGQNNIKKRESFRGKFLWFMIVVKPSQIFRFFYCLDDLCLNLNPKKVAIESKNQSLFCNLREFPRNEQSRPPLRLESFKLLTLLQRSPHMRWIEKLRQLFFSLFVVTSLRRQKMIL